MILENEEEHLLALRQIEILGSVASRVHREDLVAWRQLLVDAVQAYATASLGVRGSSLTSLKQLLIDGARRAQESIDYLLAIATGYRRPLVHKIVSHESLACGEDFEDLPKGDTRDVDWAKVTCPECLVSK